MRDFALRFGVQTRSENVDQHSHPFTVPNYSSDLQNSLSLNNYLCYCNSWKTAHLALSVMDRMIALSPSVTPASSVGAVFA